MTRSTSRRDARRAAWPVAALFALVGLAGASAQEAATPAGGREGRAEKAREKSAPGREEGGGSHGGSEEGGAEFPSPLGPLFDALNPARLQRRLDERLGLDSGDQSDKPRAPDVPLAVFREVIRPLGALKGENELNYFEGVFSRTPDLQTSSFEYVFADWNAARFEVEWTGGRLEALGAGYQRTVGVGPQHNYVHGFLLLPEYLVRNDFLGGRAIYTFAWKPEEESPWSFTLTGGADRSLFERPDSAERSPLSLSPADQSAGERREKEGEGRSSVWRPFLSANVFYSLSKSLNVGLETVALPHARFGEYLVLPHFTWRPTEHFFVQVGAGYYQFGSDSQATFMVRANLLNPSSRKPRPD